MIKTICILGGGTSGYLTAAYLRSSIPDGVKILLIESSKVGIIGVGEGTQPYTTEFLRKCGLQPIDWMKDANATYKLGVEFTKIKEEYQKLSKIYQESKINNNIPLN